MGTNSGGDLLLRARPRRAAAAARPARGRSCARRSATAAWPPTRGCPPSRSLAADLGVSRRLVVDAYAQLLAEGYLTARPGAGTFVAAGAAQRRCGCPDRRPPGRCVRLLPRLPRSRRRFRGAPGCAPCGRSSARPPTARSATPIRGARRSCGVRSPGTCAACGGSSRTRARSLVCSGAAQALRAARRACSAATWRSRSRIPGLPLHRAILAAAGASLRRAAGRRATARGWRSSSALVPGRRARHPRPPVADRGGAVAGPPGGAARAGRARGRRS